MAGSGDTRADPFGFPEMEGSLTKILDQRMTGDLLECWEDGGWPTHEFEIWIPAVSEVAARPLLGGSKDFVSFISCFPCREISRLHNRD